ASLVPLSRSSSGYFLGAAMLLILPWIQSLHQTRGDSAHPRAWSATLVSGWSLRRLYLVRKGADQHSRCPTFLAFKCDDPDMRYATLMTPVCRHWRHPVKEDAPHHLVRGIMRSVSSG